MKNFGGYDNLKNNLYQILTGFPKIKLFNK